MSVNFVRWVILSVPVFIGMYRRMWMGFDTIFPVSRSLSLTDLIEVNSKLKCLKGYS
jgi:hypothetical protein